MLRYEDQLTLPLLYHLNSEPWMNLDAYQDPSVHMEFKSTGAEDRAIPLSEPSASPLLDMVRARQSCREFTALSITREQLSDLLHAAYGIIGMRTWQNGFRSFRRAVPSAGGLYPLELYAVCDHVEGIAPGVYHFQARNRTVEPYIEQCSVANMVPFLMRQSYIEGASVLVLLTAVFQRTARKYGPRGYRYVLIEAGHVAQNLCLRAAELHLATLCIGGFNDGPLNALLGLDGCLEAAVYGVAIGHARGASEMAAERRGYGVRA